MSKRMWKVALALGALAIPVVFSVQAGDAQVKKGKTRPAATKVLMKGLIGPQCGGLGASLKDSGPADEAAWDKALVQATLLNEMGYSLMDDGRCPDGVWADSCKTLRDCSAKVLECVAAKDLAGAKEAFGKLTGACASCHGAHKK